MSNISRFFVFLLFVWNLGANEFVLTIPKSGTHLMKKYFYLVKKLHPEFTIPVIDHFVSGMHRQNPKIPRKINPSLHDAMKNREEKVKLILLIRDLRDVIVSMAFHAMNDLPVPCPEKNRPTKESWPLSQTIQHCIIQSDRLKMGEWLDNLYFFMHSAYSKYVVKFEDIVGPEGGGDREVQEKVIFDIAYFLDLELPIYEINWIADRLFGQDDCPSDITITFRSGHIGGWKRFFSKENKFYFKEKFQHFLLDFDYEENGDW